MGRYASPEEAYRAFFETFNRKDAEAWAEVMNYPHVRVAPVGGAEVNKASAGVPRTPARLYPTVADYAAAADWERFERTGWVRTEGIPPQRIHESENVVHLAGGWSRYNAAGEAFVTNRVCYVLTKVGGGWGIQARFGVDSWVADEDRSEQEEAAKAVVERLFELEAAGDAEGIATLFRYPLTLVGPEFVMQLQNADEFLALGDDADDPDAATELLEAPRAVQSGRRGVNISVGYRIAGEQPVRELILVTMVEGEGWKIAARSGVAAG